MRAIFNMRGASTQARVRMILFKWNDTDIPVAADILVADNQASVYVLSNKFKVLMDKTMWMSTTKPFVMMKSYKKLNIKCNFVGSLGANIRNGSIWMYLLSLESTEADKPFIDMDMRLRYTDG